MVASNSENYSYLNNDTVKVQDIDQVNEFRRSIGLPVIKPKSRKCLYCGEEFVSENSGIRLCPVHRKGTSVH